MIRARRALAGVLAVALSSGAVPPAAQEAFASAVAVQAPVRAQVSVPAVPAGIGSSVGGGLSTPAASLTLAGPGLPSAALPLPKASRPAGRSAALIAGKSAVPLARGTVLTRKQVPLSGVRAPGRSVVVGARSVSGRSAAQGGLLRSVSSALRPVSAALRQGRVLTGAIPLLGRFWDGARGRGASTRETEAGSQPASARSRLRRAKDIPKKLLKRVDLVRFPPPVESELKKPAEGEKPAWWAWARVRDLWKRTLGRAFSLDDTPRSIARGVALGMLIAMTPTIGIQWALVILLSRLLKANLAAMMSVIWVSNPLTMAPLYMLDYNIGRLLYQGPALGEGAWVAFQEAMSEGLIAGFSEILSVGLQTFLTTMLGGLILGAALAVPLYFLTLYGVRRYRAHKARKAERQEET